MQYLTKNQLIAAAKNSFQQFTLGCQAVDDQQFFTGPAPGKWSVAEHVQHLITSTATTTLAYTLPLFIVRLMGGRPNRDSRSYESLVAKYKAKLAAGGVATGRFVPTSKTISKSRQQLLDKWQKVTQRFIQALHHSITESDLDDYLVKHPLLGRITLRELCYFTIYHTAHHLQLIQPANDQNDTFTPLTPTSP